MNKLISIMSAAVLTASAVQIAPANAAPDPMVYVPSVSFKAEASDYARVLSDGSVVINKRDFPKDTDLALKCSIYVHDESLAAGVVTPQWKSSSPLLALDNLVNVYKPPVEFAYAQKNDKGELFARYTVIVSNNKDLNIMSFVCMSASMSGDTSSLVPYGEASDSFPLTSFDVKIDPSIEEGDQKIFFIVEDVDYENQSRTEIYLNTEEGDRKLIPEVNDLKISIADYKLGDVDEDGSISSADATQALIAYSELSVGSEVSLSNNQQFAADVNGDTQINSSDATAILAYYSYLSTFSGETPLSIEEYTK